MEWRKDVRRLRRSSLSAPQLEPPQPTCMQWPWSASLMQTPARCDQREGIKMTTSPPRLSHSSYPSCPAPTNPIMEEEYCPIDDRRSSAEVSLKLAVVHFTTMTAYCHLLSMRGEPTKVICKKMVLFFIYPGSIIIQHVLAILAIVSALVLVNFKKRRNSKPLQLSLKRAPFILFGAIEQQPPHSGPHSSDEESIVKIIGRAIVVLALGAQCIGSCIVFARRYQHDATTIADWRVLDLATAALLITLLTVVHLFWHPELRLSPNESLGKPQKDHLTFLDVTLLYMREMPARVDSDSSKDEREKWQRRCLEVYFNVPIVLGTYWAQSWEARQPLLSLLRLFSSGGLVAKLGVFDYKSPICDECASRLWFEVFASALQIFFLIVTTTVSAISVAELSAKVFPEHWTAVSVWWILLRTLVLMPLSVLIWGLAGILYLLSCLSFPLWIVLLFIAQIFHLVVELLILASWPTDFECPLLWSDPKANVLWHLM